MGWQGELGDPLSWPCTGTHEPLTSCVAALALMEKVRQHEARANSPPPAR